MFEKTNISRLIQKVKTFAETHNFKLGSSPQSRDKKVVAKTFHKLGIVVPYDKKTQLGYRELAASNGEFFFYQKDFFVQIISFRFRMCEKLIEW